ncbi:MAG: hypothetical protein O3B25_07395, partial [Verrucomicrobia bacterium]|nr:hypothetical protein [Verrucomicrobiota bacterium]
MKNAILNKFCITFLLPLFAISGFAAKADGKKLQIFILAGQSNMVGHANSHTIATLYDSDDAGDKRLTQLVFKKGSDLSKKSLGEQLSEGRNIDELTGGISNDKIKKMSAGPEKTALEAKVKQHKEAYEAYRKQVVSACVVSDQVYISSIADGNKRSGPLSVGYGGNQDKIGPEFGFGLSMAQKLDAPILIIKTSWGGKSINYNFRPPS